MSLKSKSDLRKYLKEILRGSSSELWLEKSRDVSKNITRFLDNHLPEKFPTHSSKGIIGGYAPLKDEVDWLCNFQRLEQLAFPGTDENGQMCFFHCHPSDLIESDNFGVVIKVPPSDALKVMPDFLFIPGLGFGRLGERLGRGKGYYDMYLEKFNGLKIGICTSEQIIEGIPTESHDIKMDGLITEKEIFII